MVSSNSKGDRGERDLLNFLAGDGWTAMRAPASGAGTDRDLPDILVGRGGLFVAMEAKVSSNDKVYLDGAEVEALQQFAEDFGAVPVVAVKFDVERGDPAWGEDRPGFYILTVGELYVTDGGNYRVTRGKALGSVPESEMFSELRGAQDGH